MRTRAASDLGRKRPGVSLEQHGGHSVRIAEGHSVVRAPPADAPGVPLRALSLGVLVAYSSLIVSQALCLQPLLVLKLEVTKMMML